MDHPELDIRNREIAFGGFFRVDRFHLRQRRYDGGWSRELEREVVLRPEAMAALLYDPERDTVVLVEQIRLAAAVAGFPPRQVEIPAGLAEPDEDILDVLRREVREETGCEIQGEPVRITRMLTSPGGSTECVSMFAAKVDSSKASGVHGVSSEDEDIRVVVLSRAERDAQIEDGRIVNGFTILAALWLRTEHQRLIRLWR
jgi:ADP-ribose pyrophosphatase